MTGRPRNWLPQSCRLDDAYRTVLIKHSATISNIEILTHTNPCFTHWALIAAHYSRTPHNQYRLTTRTIWHKGKVTTLIIMENHRIQHLLYDIWTVVSIAIWFGPSVRPSPLASPPKPVERHAGGNLPITNMGLRDMHVSSCFIIFHHAGDCWCRCIYIQICFQSISPLYPVWQIATCSGPSVWSLRALPTETFWVTFSAINGYCVVTTFKSFRPLKKLIYIKNSYQRWFPVLWWQQMAWCPRLDKPQPRPALLAMPCRQGQISLAQLVTCLMIFATWK